jgi:alkylated DNA repair dioxygenase AlkB
MTKRACETEDVCENKRHELSGPDAPLALPLALPLVKVFEYKESYFAARRMMPEERTLMKLAVADIKNNKMLAQYQLKVYGRICNEAHLSALILRKGSTVTHYEYSGLRNPALEGTDATEKIFELYDKLFPGNNANTFLCNCYENGDRSIGAHSDSEKYLDKSVGVVTFEIGAERDLVFTSKTEKTLKDKPKVVHTYKTQNGAMSIMGGKFQDELKHEIPKALKAWGVVGERVSFTFRRIYE